MASAPGVTEADDPECSICNESFTKPKLLPCGHFLCRHCLLSLLKRRKKPKSLKKTTCPLCRHPIMNPATQQHQSHESFVDSLPTDEGMNITVECERLLKTDHKCQSCVNQAASSLCLQCRDFLCSSCSAMHGRLSSTRDHSVETLASLTADKLMASYRTPCHQHPQEQARLYCSTHRASICLVCASTKHHSCSEIKEGEEREEEMRASLTELMSKLRSQETLVDLAIQELEDHFQDQKKEEQTALKAISHSFDRLQSVITESRRQMEETTRRKLDESKTLIGDRKAQLLQKRNAVTARIAVVDRGKKVAAMGEVQDMAQAVEKQADDFDSCALVPEDGKILVKTTLEINQHLISSVEKDLQNLGHHEVIRVSLIVQPEGNFFFHRNCGKHAILSNTRQTAEKKADVVKNAIVMSSQPMIPRRLYEVQLDQEDAGAPEGWPIWVGAVTADPGRITLPAFAFRWTEAVVFSDSQVSVHGKVTRHDAGAKLWNVPDQTRVGVMIDDSRHLHLFVDGQDEGKVDVPLPSPCFACFDVCGDYLLMDRFSDVAEPNRKITTLPVRIAA